MADDIKRKEEKEKPKKKGYAYYAREQRNRRKSQKMYQFTRGILIPGLILLPILWILLSGQVNQKDLVSQSFEKVSKWGKQMGDQIVQIFTGKNDKVRITDEGIYFKDKEPDGAKNIMDNDGVKDPYAVENESKPSESSSSSEPGNE